MSNIKPESSPKYLCDEKNDYDAIDDYDDKDLCIYEIKRYSTYEDKNKFIYEIEPDDKVYDKEKFMLEQKYYDKFEDKSNIESLMLEEDK